MEPDISNFLNCKSKIQLFFIEVGITLTNTKLEISLTNRFEKVFSVEL